jgi:hypothetical protein
VVVVVWARTLFSDIIWRLPTRECGQLESPNHGAPHAPFALRATEMTAGPVVSALVITVPPPILGNEDTVPNAWCVCVCVCVCVGGEGGSDVARKSAIVREAPDQQPLEWQMHEVTCQDQRMRARCRPGLAKTNARCRSLAKTNA